MAQLLTSSGGLSGEYQKYFDKKLLTAVLQKLVMAQFPQTRNLPPGMGALTVRFTRPMAPDRSTVSALTEGTAISSDSDYSLTFVDATCTQVGQKTTISDILGETNLFDTLQLVSTWMGQNASLYYDFAVTTEYQSGVNATNKQYAGGAADWTTLAALPTTDGKLAITDLLKAFTRLTAARAPKATANTHTPAGTKGGTDYVAIVAPQPGYDIRQDKLFQDAGVRGNNDGLFNGEFGSWYGMKLVEATQPWREATGGAEGTFSSTGGIYATICTGSEAVGMVNLASQNITRPSLQVLAKGDKTDPLNQFTSVGWKSFFKVKTLKDDWSVIVRSLTTYA
jgi:N4-gp56 family major capsid protein